MIPLEDEFCDVLKKAMRGVGVDSAQLARLVGLDAGAVNAWVSGATLPTDDQARAIASPLALDPEKLADSAAGRYLPPAIEAAQVRHHLQAPHPSNGYVFLLEGGARAALVDPAGLPANLLTMLRDGKYHLQYILITHKHADHCDATAEMSAAFPDAKIVMHQADVHAIGALASRAILVKDGDELPFSDDVRIRTLHTPGHTDGSSSYLMRSTVFTGDTLFAGSIGGAYGDASTYQDVLNSVRTKLFALPDETVVMPGHGPPTTIALEKAHNPFIS